MFTEATARAFEAYGQKMACGSADKQWVDSSEPLKGREFNSALENVVGLLAFCVVINEPGEEAAMLQFKVG